MHQLGTIATVRAPTRPSYLLAMSSKWALLGCAFAAVDARAAPNDSQLMSFYARSTHTNSSEQQLLAEAWAGPPTPKWLARALDGREPSTDVPKHIWMFWDRGLAGAPASVLQCITSWVIMNPKWRVRLLTDEVILPYLGPGWTREKWEQISPGAHKGDIVRVCVLRTFGGVWADATQFCLLPLDSWVPRAVGRGNEFFAFGTGALPSKDSPAYSSGCVGCEPPTSKPPPYAGCLTRNGAFGVDPATRRTYGISSAFLAATPGSYIANRFYERYVWYMLEHLHAPEYSYFHTCFRLLAANDTRFRKSWLAAAEISNRRVAGSLPLSGHFATKAPVGGGPLTATYKARVDRICGPTVKTT